LTYKLILADAITQKYPEYTALIIYARNLTNQPSNDYSISLLRSAEQLKRQEFNDEKASTHPHIMAWREAYKDFGAKPSKFSCSVEALLSRTLRGEDLPAINCIVDIYNAISIKYVLPVGGENLDKLTSDLVLKFAEGTETFDTIQNGEKVLVNPQQGEVVWADSSGVTCRMWNWRQCIRTQITPETLNYYFVLDSLPPFSLESLKQTGNELIEHLKVIAPNCEVEVELLGKIF
jgi:DNA/RNA-binding domain of Phe-tRNA-synthetase-like protein